MRIEGLGVSGLEAALVTDRGSVREVNEDGAVIEAWPDKSAVLLVVADGMGGQFGGGVASQLVVETFRTLLGQPVPATLFERYERLLGCFYKADEAIKRRASEDLGLMSMASTAIAAIISPTECLHLYAGDCRMYHFVDGSTPYVTRDHSVVSVLVETGLVALEEVSDHPMRSVVTSSLGAGRSSRLNVDPKWRDAANEQPAVRSVSPRDVLLFCTDGLSCEVSLDGLTSLVAQHRSDPDALVRACLDAALAKGARDNITVAVVQVTGLSTGASEAVTSPDALDRNIEYRDPTVASAVSQQLVTPIVSDKDAE